ncbi:hypothetical protein N9J07_03435 [Bacteroidia bacterium]|nr:hypothetical protein [Bacteroidia bacterium]
MERTKTALIELPELEAEVLRLCMFAESFESIISECTTEEKEGIIADAIKNLIHFKLLVAANEAVSLTWVYDSDKMRESSFKATANGIEWMEMNT